MPETVPTRMREAQRRRELQSLQDNHSFVYFEGGPESRAHASSVLEKLLGAANVRCILHDEFLSAADVLRFVPFVRTQRLPIRVLGSKWFLRQKVERSKPGPNRADQLAEALLELNKDRTLRVECRVIRGGDKSLVHDRILVVDSEAYLLGSSINELGSRVTTLFRVPVPDKLIVEVEAWWSDPRFSLPLSDVVSAASGQVGH